jgi:dinuclear metal center YbgI/SA1388 family protein
MKVRELVEAMEQIAPSDRAEPWDNVGLLIGDARAEFDKLLLCIDLTEAVLDEAIGAGCEAVVSYHPVVFHPLKRIGPEACPIAWRAINSGVAVYSPHTALDVAVGGTNDVLAETLELTDVRPLQPAEPAETTKLVVFVPAGELDLVASAAFEAGAGRIGLYDHCSFRIDGTGTFRGGQGSDPSVGQVGRVEQVDEVRVEMVCPPDKVAQVVRAVGQTHSYETPAIDVYPMRDPDPRGLGLGRVGELARPVEVDALVDTIKSAFGLDGVLLARGAGARAQPMVSRVAVAAGSCGALFGQALEAGADLYLTGEMRHHDALAAAAAGLHVVALCHSNSERIALRRLADALAQRLDEIEIVLSDADADPFSIQ